MQTHYPVIIVGGGQAGLALSYLLKQNNIDHLIFEKHKVGHAWRNERWNSFCLVTPNWQCRLPGFSYAGPDPNGFMAKEEIVSYLEAYARSFNPPIREGVTVLKVSSSGTKFAVATSIGDYTADQVAIATGGYHVPKIPPIAAQLPRDVQQIHSVQYKNPQDLPDEVLIVGTGQSGCQIAEDLHLAGKTVHLVTGSAPRAPRRYRGKDVVEWLERMGYYDLPIDQHPQKEMVRHKTNHYVTGRDGGRDIDLRRFAQQGMHLYGRLQSITGQTLHFGKDLKQNLDRADTTVVRIQRNIDKFIADNNITAPPEAHYQPVWEPELEPSSLNLKATNIGAVIWATGFRLNFSWIDLPIFNELGEPLHDRGVTAVDGLYFLGLPWLYTWGSGRFSGVTRDAEYLATQITARLLVPASA
ncbi:MSMEG_0569 family flavin-dependent oxidoreductase [Picosynechococcus sp. PCC 7117]|uniref:MSMEG_0569 family flavin-dependent oxidoreductase n=1 Tax=Picosynechococcus sp. PCC 7117 TaxID=195498 RepID=UPI000810477F|nr:MSMEG_0569 family flavin-dependent oxidoreductase [Picosynechococcus sp. PCC 7117]ANV86592.1 FAD-dependent oxidoreductase [Picosynechococcus sp. PCC 7117]